MLKELEATIKKPFSQVEIRRQLEDLMQKKKLEEELDDFGD